MIKAILMIYICMFCVIASVMHDAIEVRGFAVGISFSAGMFAYRFIMEDVRSKDD